MRIYIKDVDLKMIRRERSPMKGFGSVYVIAPTDANIRMLFPSVDRLKGFAKKYLGGMIYVEDERTWDLIIHMPCGVNVQKRATFFAAVTASSHKQ